MEGLDIDSVSQIVALGPLGVVVYIAWRLLQVATRAVDTLGGLIAHLEDHDPNATEAIETCATLKRAVDALGDGLDRARADLDRHRKSTSGSIGQLTRRYAELELRIGSGPIEPTEEPRTFDDALRIARQYAGQQATGQGTAPAAAPEPPIR